MRFKHIVFDIDGTLLDTEYAVLHALQDALKETNQPVLPLEKLAFVFGIPGVKALQELQVGDILKTLDLWERSLKNYTHTISIFDGIREILAALKTDGFQLGIITSKSRKEFEEDFLPSGLAPYFTISICTDDTREHKPTPAPLLKYMELARCTPDELIYIGDSIYDMQCAEGARVTSGLALWGCHSPKGISASYYLKHPRDILDIART